ncbi:MAG TPA: ACP S-malonyltransferase [Acidobacteriota bacterium]|nr:ACP S-malonyltransferase [Acidobacteriota bacterium]
MARIVLVAPGRGTYGKSELGYLSRFQEHPRFSERERLVGEADEMRRRRSQPTVSELDAAQRFSSALHLPGENASALIFTCTAADAALLNPDHEVVAVVGNSMGWYSALYLCGALGFAEAFRLVNEMGLQQRGNVRGGQIIYPLVEDHDWRPRRGSLEKVLELARSVSDDDAQALAAQGEPPSESACWAGLSIRLGGYAVLGGTPSGLEAMSEKLPPVTRNGRQFPLQLAYHSAFHTPLMEPLSRFARRKLNDLEWHQPHTPAIDGRGAQWKPMQTLAEALSLYTLEEQVLRPFDFSAAVRVAALEYNPDHFVLLGPGESLGGALAQVLIAEGWRGLSDRESFQKAQRSGQPPLISLNRLNQAASII